MALTPSNMLPLGTKAPYFKLIDVITNTSKDLDQLKGYNATVVMFICNHCPFVKHINTELARLGNDYLSKGVSIIAISSNDAINYPEDQPLKLVEQAKEFNFNFPYLYDESQAVAKAYQAACTPDFYIFDKDLKLKYRGQLDDSRPSNGVPVTGSDLRKALEGIISNSKLPDVQKPSIGCNIKWK